MMHYPKLIIDLQKLRENVRAVVAMSEAQGISVAGVTKGCNGIPECSEVMIEEGCKWLASSRLEHFEYAQKYGLKSSNMMIRIPMLSELERMLDLCDVSLNSEERVIKKIAEISAKKGIVHKIILMLEMGDLREGIFEDEEMLRIAKFIEESPNLHLYGVGTNLGCYGAIVATEKKLDELVGRAELVEKAIGRKLEIISGGASMSMARLLDGDMPERINHLRVGENNLMALDLRELWGYKDLPVPHIDVFTVEAEVIESKMKPSLPSGEIMYDAFRNIPEFEDRGDRQRALIALGKADYANVDQIIPMNEGVQVLGASSDHTVLDVEDVPGGVNTGDLLKFRMTYGSMVFLTASTNLEKVFI